MQISKISNNQNSFPSFQMRYKSPCLWNKELLSYVASSNLVKEIDAKYPKASVKMKSSLPLTQRLQYGSAGVEFDLDKGQKFSINADKTNLNTFDEYYDLFTKAGQKVYNTKLETIENELANIPKKTEKSNAFFAIIRNFAGLNK